ncbi:MAG: hypothetical protein JWP97_619 [Labilithrix sp.]|nr:hypothetical protein [Labilithrix sp.]
MRYEPVVTRLTIPALACFVALAACSHGGSSDVPGPRGAAASPAAHADGSAPPSAPGAMFAASPAPATPADPPRCEDASAVAIFVSPATPWTGAPLRVVAVSEKPLVGELRVTGAKSPASPATSDARGGGPPYFWVAEIAGPQAGAHEATLTQQACDPGKNVAAKRIAVSASRPNAPAGPTKETDGIWPTYRAWNRSFEDLYSAWIERLFDAPDGEMPSWPALHEVLRDPKRNLLFDHLAAGEDSSNATTIHPDCADLPYFLRAYFAFKLRLPFGVSECNRGGGGIPPSCKKDVIVTNEDPAPRTESAPGDKPVPPGANAVKAFGNFLRGTLADKAHSGSARQPFDEPSSDYYPVPLAAESLRPGTIFADPYGHVLMLARRIPQTSERGGQLIAVDAQPDGTVARKRYWRGNFLYATQPELGGPGFKRFRPVARRKGKLERLADDAIAKSAEYGDLSREASALDVEGFYDRMDDVLSPRPLDPQRAMMETLGALEEQVRTRVKSVDNGRRWLEGARAPAAMPEGPEIFETSGAWEDFSTPSRDLRMLIAVDVARGFPARVSRRPERYAMPVGHDAAEVSAELERVLDRELHARSVQYTRTNGTAFTLPLAEVLTRSPALEMAYNPNDCVEIRWGAPPASEELATCQAHAPPDQRARMESYRAWFHERRRPARK